MMLTTLSRLKAYIGLPEAETKYDSLLESIIVGVSNFFESEVNRKFESQEYTETISGDSTEDLILNQFPVTDIESIKVDGSEIDIDAEQLSKNLFINYDAGIIERASGWYAGFRNIEVKYTAGFILPSDESGAEAQTLPDEIELMTKRMAARIYERRTAEGITSADNISYKDALDEDIKSSMMGYYKFRA